MYSVFQLPEWLSTECSPSPPSPLPGAENIHTHAPYVQCENADGKIDKKPNPKIRDHTEEK